jgi:hypothetical protein
MGGLLQRFGMDAKSLDFRRTFVGLEALDRKILSELNDWMSSNGKVIAQEFYDHQFSFPPTLAFFKAVCRQKKCTLEALRSALELAQAQYLQDICDHAQDGWSENYFEKRLNVGLIHDRLNLPLKWYIGSYTKMEDLVRSHLKDHLGLSEELLTAQSSFSKIFNLDMQLVADAFTLSNLASMGLATEGIEVDPGADVTEYLGDLKSEMAFLVQQAKAIAEDKLSDKVLEKRIPGKLGDSFSEMVEHLSQMKGRMEAISLGQFSDERFEGQQGGLGACLSRVEQTLGRLMKASDRIVQGTREGDFSLRFPQNEVAGSYRQLCLGMNELLDLMYVPRG